MIRKASKECEKKGKGEKKRYRKRGMEEKGCNKGRERGMKIWKEKRSEEKIMWKWEGKEKALYVNLI